jgi:CubicO group peptidase (beta-lactamase class C family)
VDWQAWGHRDREATLPMEKDTIARVYSMTKMVTSVAVLQLHEQARLRLDDPVERHLPALAKRQVLTGGTAQAPELTAATRSMTIKDLLTHTSGYTYGGLFGKETIDELYTREKVLEATTMDEFIERLARVPLVHQPGARFNYGVSTDVLGAVVEKVTGQRLDRYVAEHITAPLRARQSESPANVSTCRHTSPRAILIRRGLPDRRVIARRRSDLPGRDGAQRPP